MFKTEYTFDKTMKEINQKYHEFVALCVGELGLLWKLYMAFLQISKLWTVTWLANRIKKRLPE